MRQGSYRWLLTLKPVQRGEVTLWALVQNNGLDRSVARRFIKLLFAIIGLLLINEINIIIENRRRSKSLHQNYQFLFRFQCCIFQFRPTTVSTPLQGKASYWWYWCGCEVEIRRTRPKFCQPYGPAPSIQNFSDALDSAVEVIKNGSADLVGRWL